MGIWTFLLVLIQHLKLNMLTGQQTVYHHFKFNIFYNSWPLSYIEICSEKLIKSILTIVTIFRTGTNFVSIFQSLI